MKAKMIREFRLPLFITTRIDSISLYVDSFRKHYEQTSMKAKMIREFGLPLFIATRIDSISLYVDSFDESKGLSVFSLLHVKGYNARKVLTI
jgi:hypothetical protein